MYKKICIRKFLMLVTCLYVLLLLSACITLETSRTTGPSKFKIVEVKHFTQVDGLGLSQVFVNSFYDGLREGLTKIKVADQAVDEGATVPEADVANSVVVEGKFTEYKKAWYGIIIDLEIKLYRKSDHTLITTITPSVACKSSPFNTDTNVGKFTGESTAYKIKKALK